MRKHSERKSESTVKHEKGKGTKIKAKVTRRFKCATPLPQFEVPDAVDYSDWAYEYDSWGYDPIHDDLLKD